MPALCVQIAQVEEQQKSDPPCRAGAASRSATRPRWIASSPSGVSGAHVQNPAELDKLRATEPLWGTKIVDPRAMDIRRRRRPATRTSAKRASTANTPCGQTGELARQRAEMVRQFARGISRGSTPRKVRVAPAISRRPRDARTYVATGRLRSIAKFFN